MGAMLVEMALVRLGRLDDLVSLAQLAQWLSKPAATTRAPPGSELRRRRPAVRGAAGAGKKKVAERLRLPATDPTAVPLTAESLPQIWAELLAQLAGRCLRSDLEKAGIPAISGPNTLVLRFAAGL